MVAIGNELYPDWIPPRAAENPVIRREFMRQLRKMQGVVTPPPAPTSSTVSLAPERDHLRRQYEQTVAQAGVSFAAYAMSMAQFILIGGLLNRIKEASKPGRARLQWAIALCTMIFGALFAYVLAQNASSNAVSLQLLVKAGLFGLVGIASGAVGWIVAERLMRRDMLAWPIPAYSFIGALLLMLTLRRDAPIRHRVEYGALGLLLTLLPIVAGSLVFVLIGDQVIPPTIEAAKGWSWWHAWLLLGVAAPLLVVYIGVIAWYRPLLPIVEVCAKLAARVAFRRGHDGSVRWPSDCDPETVLPPLLVGITTSSRS